MTSSNESDGGKTKENDLNRFGRWVNALNTIVGTNITEMAERIGVQKSTLSTAMHGQRGMLTSNIVALAVAYRDLAREREVPLPASWDSHFGLSWYNSADLGGRGDQTLASLQYSAMQSRVIVSMAREIVRLTSENETLKRNGSDTKKRS